ncbi:E3 ubiquitin-protein ligase [Phytophthora cinnamomi]|uniref:E3 ubiquitin-protein ligase n=1 Tax=Phytophthora cinnamomi TaxID=4785 RepID=UPI003559ED4E|nr:E3 ubiquitin-protein ligase [Phytophthora cinnamomi]
MKSKHRSKSACNFESEGKKSEEAENLVKRIEEEKTALEEKQRALMKTLKGASSRAADVERKKNELSRVEDQLTEQLATLKKENLELKARRGQMSSQTKHLQARVAALENANTLQEQQLEDAAMELETARKYCRDCQFRAKQLQEEIVFLKNRKVAATAPSIDSPAPTTNNSPPPEPKLSPDTDADDVPCWMKNG